MHTKANQCSVDWCQTQQLTTPCAPPPIRDDDGVRFLLNETLSPLFLNSLIWTGKIHNSWMTDRTKNVYDSPMHTKANQRSVNQCLTLNQCPTHIIMKSSQNDDSLDSFILA